MTDPAHDDGTTHIANRLAVQMYGLRELDLPLGDLLREVAAAGYGGIETVGTQGVAADELLKLLEKHGLEVASSHVALSDLEADPDAVIAFNRAVSNDTLIVPWLPPEARPQHAAGWRALGARLGDLAAVCSAPGMTLLYHNHDFEMVEIDGQLALEHLLAGAPATLGLELDLAWVVRGGGDPLELLRRFHGRVPRVHLKDLAPAGENEDEDGWADVGSGTLPWDALLSASREAGAQWFVVEHDKPKDPLASIRNSAAYLKGRR